MYIYGCSIGFTVSTLPVYTIQNILLNAFTILLCQPSGWRNEMVEAFNSMLLQAGLELGFLRL